jgi:hypothetical protein
MNDTKNVVTMQSQQIQNLGLFSHLTKQMNIVELNEFLEDCTNGINEVLPWFTAMDSHMSEFLKTLNTLNSTAQNINNGINQFLERYPKSIVFRNSGDVSIKEREVMEAWSKLHENYEVVKRLGSSASECVPTLQVIVEAQEKLNEIETLIPKSVSDSAFTTTDEEVFKNPSLLIQQMEVITSFMDPLALAKGSHQVIDSLINVQIPSEFQLLIDLIHHLNAHCDHLKQRAIQFSQELLFPFILEAWEAWQKFCDSKRKSFLLLQHELEGITTLENYMDFMEKGRPILESSKSILQSAVDSVLPSLQWTTQQALEHLELNQGRTVKLIEDQALEQWNACLDQCRATEEKFSCEAKREEFAKTFRKAQNRISKIEIDFKSIPDGTPSGKASEISDQLQSLEAQLEHLGIKVDSDTTAAPWMNHLLSEFKSTMQSMKQAIHAIKVEEDSQSRASPTSSEGSQMENSSHHGLPQNDFVKSVAQPYQLRSQEAVPRSYNDLELERRQSPSPLQHDDSVSNQRSSNEPNRYDTAATSLDDPPVRSHSREQTFSPRGVPIRMKMQRELPSYERRPSAPTTRFERNVGHVNNRRPSDACVSYGHEAPSSSPKISKKRHVVPPSPRKPNAHCQSLEEPQIAIPSLFEKLMLIDNKEDNSAPSGDGSSIRNANANARTNDDIMDQGEDESMNLITQMNELSRIVEAEIQDSETDSGVSWEEEERQRISLFEINQVTKKGLQGAIQRMEKQQVQIEQFKSSNYFQRMQAHRNSSNNFKDRFIFVHNEVQQFLTSCMRNIQFREELFANSMSSIRGVLKSDDVSIKDQTGNRDLVAQSARLFSRIKTALQQVEFLREKSYGNHAVQDNLREIKSEFDRIQIQHSKFQADVTTHRLGLCLATEFVIRCFSKVLDLTVASSQLEKDHTIPDAFEGDFNASEILKRVEFSQINEAQNNEIAKVEDSFLHWLISVVGQLLRQKNDSTNISSILKSLEEAISEVIHVQRCRRILKSKSLLLFVSWLPPRASTVNNAKVSGFWAQLKDSSAIVDSSFSYLRQLRNQMDSLAPDLDVMLTCRNSVDPVLKSITDVSKLWNRFGSKIACNSKLLHILEIIYDFDQAMSNYDASFSSLQQGVNSLSQSESLEIKSMKFQHVSSNVERLCDSINLMSQTFIPRGQTARNPYLLCLFFERLEFVCEALKESALELISKESYSVKAKKVVESCRSLSSKVDTLLQNIKQRQETISSDLFFEMRGSDADVFVKTAYSGFQMLSRDLQEIINSRELLTQDRQQLDEAAKIGLSKEMTSLLLYMDGGISELEKLLNDEALHIDVLRRVQSHLLATDHLIQWIASNREVMASRSDQIDNSPARKANDEHLAKFIPQLNKYVEISDKLLKLMNERSMTVKSFALVDSYPKAIHVIRQRKERVVSNWRQIYHNFGAAPPRPEVARTPESRSDDHNGTRANVQKGPSNSRSRTRENSQSSLSSTPGAAKGQRNLPSPIQYNSDPNDMIDVRIGQVVNELGVLVPVRRVAPGLYQFGPSNSDLLHCKLTDGQQLLVRVNETWKSFADHILNSELRAYCS